MPTTEEKIRENRLRRAAKRRGWELVKLVKATSDSESCWLVVDLETAKIVSGLLLLSIRDVAVFLDVDAQ
jgi:hypothetical protein